MSITKGMHGYEELVNIAGQVTGIFDENELSPAECWTVLGILQGAEVQNVINANIERRKK